LVPPSFALTTFARKPLTRTVSTTTCRDSNGSSLSETCASSTRANSLSEARSDSDALPILAPMLGQNDSLMSPSSLRVRCVRSFTACTSRGLYSLGSKVAAT
jgi:hypothetical protein